MSMSMSMSMSIEHEVQPWPYIPNPGVSYGREERVIRTWHCASVREMAHSGAFIAKFHYRPIEDRG